MIISGWGKNNLVKCKIAKPRTIQAIKRQIEKNCIARGMGRSYGDSSIQPNKTIIMTNYSKILKFDKKNGIIKTQAGISLFELLKFIIPKGWFVPVSPGTKYVTIGGMIASNVHGKNHHKVGGMINHLIDIKLIDENKKIKLCSKSQQKNLFFATCGGMGLTGIILEATIKLKKIETSLIREKTYCTKNLDETISRIVKSNIHEYSIAWIDCTASNKKFGRGVIFCGEHLKNDFKFKNNKKLHFIEKKKIKIFFSLPKFIFNSFFIKIFNTLYYYLNYFKKQNNIVDYDKFFYPLDSLLNWNNLYGKEGFIQYQCVVSKKKNILNILKTFKNSNIKSFLVTIKILKKDKGLLSFPIKGYTLAFDIPNGKHNLDLINDLNEIILKSKGRIYLTKDSLMNETLFKKIYNNNLNKFKKIIRTKKNRQIFESLQSSKLGI